MKISDREKKLVLIVLLAAIIALPIFFFIKPKIEETNELKAELVTLNERHEYLKDLYQKMGYYEDEIARLIKERNELINHYAQGILQENTIMFLRDAEIKYDMQMAVLSFAEIDETHISDGYTNEDGEFVEGLDAIKSSIAISYKCEYDEMKKFIDYIFANKEKMLLSDIQMKLASDDRIEGTFVFDQFAITGEGRSLDQVKVTGLEHETDRIFGYNPKEDEEEAQNPEAVQE